MEAIRHSSSCTAIPKYHEDTMAGTAETMPDRSNVEEEVGSFAARLIEGDRGDHRHPRRYSARSPDGPGVSQVARLLLNYNHDEEEEEEEDDEEEEEEDDVSTATRVRPPVEAFRAELPPEDAAEPDLLMGGGSSVDDGGTTVAPSSQGSLMIPAVPNLQRLLEHPSLREIGMEDIISFQLSSAKPGNGVEQLQDPNLETYWQSDGLTQPHWIQVQLPRRLPITHVALYLDYQLDESYTPRMVRIETGLTVVQDMPSSYHNNSASGTSIMEINEPVGWCIFPIYLPPAEDTNTPFDVNFIPEHHMMVPRAHWVRISILSMHQNGRDTHVRRMALFGQRTAPMTALPSGPIRRTVPTKQGMPQSSSTAVEEDATTDHEEILLYAHTRRRHTSLLQRPEVASSNVRAEDVAFTSNRNHSSSFGMSLFSTIR
jgi:anaphase-promoting complex subunit 10